MTGPRLDVWLVEHGLAESREKAQALVMAGREQGAVHGRELLPVLVTDDDARLQGEDAGVLIRLVPDAWLAFGDMHLPE